MPTMTERLVDSVAIEMVGNFWFLVCGMNRKSAHQLGCLTLRSAIGINRKLKTVNDLFCSIHKIVMIKLLDAFVGVRKDFVERADSFKPPIQQHRYPVAGGFGTGQVVGDNDRRGT